jgi:hypothetical protein
LAREEYSMDDKVAISNEDSIMVAVWESLGLLDAKHEDQTKLKMIAKEQEAKFKKACEDSSFVKGRSAGQREMLQKLLLDLEDFSGAVPKMSRAAAAAHATGLSREGNPAQLQVFKSYSKAHPTAELQKRNVEPQDSKERTANLTEVASKKAATMDGLLLDMKACLKSDRLVQLEEKARSQGDESEVDKYKAKRMKLLFLAEGNDSDKED